LRELERIAVELPPDQAGVRLYGVPALRPLLAWSGAIGGVAASVLGEAARPVRALLFDKTSSTNWGLPWHQDRTIVVTRRVEVEGFGPWTVKSGLLHVAPPFDLLAGMVTLRVHLDPVPETNAPLLIAPGSHRLGQIPEGELKSVVQQCGIATALPTPETSGSTRRRSFTAPRRLATLLTEECYKPISQPAISPAG
jgi:hypothetical protein